jgi:GNAT superfamily N-acetyltransferase
MEDVRPALPDDHPRCVELLTAALEESAGARGADLLARIGVFAGAGTAGDDDARAPVDVVALWSTAVPGDGPLRTLLVGTIDSVVVGVAAASIAARHPAAGRIDCCYVEPEAREVGVGAKLIESLLAWFFTHGCQEIDALALPGDRSTKQLFESSGFKTRLLVLHRSTS